MADPFRTFDTATRPSDPPSESRFDSDQIHAEDARLPRWFWPVIAFVATVFVIGMVQRV